MIKQKTILEVKSGERIYELYVSPDSPIGELYDALTQMLSFVAEKINSSIPKKEEHKDEEVA